MKQTEENFSIIIIPDTQEVSMSHPDKLQIMTQWIVDNAEALNVKMVMHVGDVVNHGAEKEIQWENHRAAFDRIDEAGIPMMIAIGNHDYDNLLRETRSSEKFNQHCGLHRYKDKPWFGGTFEPGKTENMYATLNIAGRKYVFLTMEFGPRQAVIDWANDILETYTDHEAILLTHSFLYPDGERTKPGKGHNPKDYPGTRDANDGEDLWHKCIKKHHNIVSIYSGHHVPGNVSYRLDLGDEHNLILQAFQNWQMTENGGEARIRIAHYRLSDNQVALRVYNPQTGAYEHKDGYESQHPYKFVDGAEPERFPK